MKIIRFLKDWTLPVAMVVGVLGYLAFANLQCLEPAKPMMHELIAFLTPTLIFMQLFFTFCKIELKELVPKVWHAWLLAIQLVSCLVVVAVLLWVPMPEVYRAVLAALMVCLICPTATAAAVVTGKLGGSASTLTTYTLLSNLLAAVAVPLLFPLVYPHEGLTFFAAFLIILGKVFPLLLAPFFVAVLLRYTLPRVHAVMADLHSVAFYLWAVALAIVMGQTTRSMLHSEASVGVLCLVALAGLVACAVQFALGKKIGTVYHDRISAGQALGQKNTVLAIWMAFTYLNPLSSLGPGSYVVWQNLVNSYQLWKKRKKDAAEIKAQSGWVD
jgi:BASS family bile acid:Na+ symporter